MFIVPRVQAIHIQSGVKVPVTGIPFLQHSDPSNSCWAVPSEAKKLTAGGRHFWYVAMRKK